MSSFKIEGGQKLSGTIVPQGSKNEALQVICATLLTSEKVIISNVPHILDVKLLMNLLIQLGVEIEKLQENTYSFKAENIKLNYLKTKDFYQKSSLLRGSVMIVGPMLARFGEAIFPKP
ncbi:MAG TPA: UDP-N-acetylglucosamine 1-carboxyvinyltransferase, partial [Paludibacteraceae bacterium]|nr:UDP-N-acetylglucosamine 1-carboxyvinyltransferase [Paludibacteraceae bacterium]